MLLRFIERDARDNDDPDAECTSWVITRHPGLGSGGYAASVSGSFSAVTSGSGTMGGSVSIASVSRSA